jgi:hypothetical protein|tara:strand:- start:202 stop:543 length:342 start_codon:yes stop_codon:yes gene_type:complete
MDIIQKQINESLSSESAYFPKPNQIFQVQTDINQWPYQRYFRGEASSFEPIVWEREAGFQEILVQSSVPSIIGFQNEIETSTCFQIPCSTTLPCYTKGNVYKSNGGYCVFSSP